LACVQGLPGIGKTTFLLREGAMVAEQLGGVQVYHACIDGERPTTIARALVGQLSGAPEYKPEAPLAAQLAQGAGGRAVVVCVDDLQRVDDPGVLTLLTRCAREGAQVCVALGSRAQVPLSPLEVDYLSIRLGPLEGDEVRELWRGLEHLYGARSAPLPASASPWRVRATFAGAMVRGATASDPLKALLESLEGPERDLLGCVCASREPLPAEVHERLLGEAAGAALAGLERRLLVEQGAGGVVHVHDMVRETVTGEAKLIEARHHRMLAGYYEGRLRQEASLRLSVELAHHRAEAGDVVGAVAQFEELSQAHLGIVPFDAVTDHRATQELRRLQQGGNALPGSVRRLGARLRARQGEPQAALEELERMTPRSAELEFERGVTLLMLGRFHEARASFKRVWRSKKAAPRLRLMAGMNLADVQRAQGKFTTARRRLEAQRSEFALLEPITAMVCGVLLAGLAYDERKYLQAERALDAARNAVAGTWVEAMSPRTELSLRGAVSAARGRASRVEPLHGAGLDADILYFDIMSRLLLLEGGLTAGDVATALREAPTEEARARAARYVPLALWAAHVGAKAERLSGRVPQALARLEAAAALPHAAQSTTAMWRIRWQQAASALDAGRLDQAQAALAALGALRPPAWARAEARRLGGWLDLLHGRPVSVDELPAARSRLRHVTDIEQQLGRLELLLLAGRAQQALQDGGRLQRVLDGRPFALHQQELALVLALASLHTGVVDGAEAAVQALIETLRDHDVRRLRALALALAATCARSRGNEAEASETLEKALSLAIEGGYGLLAQAIGAARSSWQGPEAAPAATPAEHLAAFLGLLGPPTVLLLSHRGVARRLIPSLATQIDTSSAQILVDGLHRTVRLHDQVIAFRERELPWRLLEVLAAAGGAAVDPGELFERVWSEPFDPLRHLNRLNVTLHRLREILDLDVIRSTSGGYRLNLAGLRWMVVLRRAAERPPATASGPPPR
jgi:tetratricopeptide (TPR) repeat protein